MQCNTMTFSTTDNTREISVWNTTIKKTLSKYFQKVVKTFATLIFIKRFDNSLTGLLLRDIRKFFEESLESARFSTSSMQLLENQQSRNCFRGITVWPVWMAQTLSFQIERNNYRFWSDWPLLVD